MVNGVWKTDLSVDVNNNGDNMIVADDFLVLGLDYHSESAGDFIQVFSGTVTSKHFSGIDIPFLVKVDGEWSIEEMSGKMILDKDNGIKLIYDMTSLEIYVGAAEITSATAGKAADVYDRISEKILSRSTNATDYRNSNQRAVKIAERIVSDYFLSRFNRVNKDGTGLEHVAVTGNTMSCDTDGAKKVYYRIKTLDEYLSVKSSPTSHLPNYDWASERAVTYNDIAGMTKEELRIMRNYIFARHGYIFRSKDLTDFFSQYPWYTPMYNNVATHLSTIETKNVAFIQKYE